MVSELFLSQGAFIFFVDSPITGICFWRGASSKRFICVWRGLFHSNFCICFWRGISSIFAGSRVDICRPALLRLHRPQAPSPPLLGNAFTAFQMQTQIPKDNKIMLQIRVCNIAWYFAYFFVDNFFPKFKRHLCFVGRPKYTQIVYILIFTFTLMQHSWWKSKWKIIT